VLANAIQLLLAVALVGAGLPAGAQTRTGGINSGPEAFTGASAPASPGSAWEIYDAWLPLVADALLAAKGTTKITSGSQVTEDVIRQTMKDAPLSTQQAGGVSLPKVRQYVDRILAGEKPPAIRVDGSIIVDGNHRYVAGRVLGQEPPVTEWMGGRPNRVIPWENIPIDPKAW
jgi:hypothetical protein